MKNPLKKQLLLLKGPAVLVIVAALAFNFVVQKRVSLEIQAKLNSLELDTEQVQYAQNFLHFFDSALKEDAEIIGHIDDSQGQGLADSLKGATAALISLRESFLAQGSETDQKEEFQILQQLQSANETLKTASERILSGISDYNAKTSESLHEEITRLEGLPILDLVTKITKIETGDISALEAQVHRSSEQIVWSIVAVAILIVGVLLIIPFIVLRKFIGPVTELQKAASELGGGNFDVKVAIHSDDEFGLLAATFNKMSKDLKNATSDILEAKVLADAANMAKSEFLANMSHEIRTPLGGVIGMTEVLLRTPVTTQQKEYLGMIKTSADALLEVITDILDFSKVEAGKLTLQSLPFSMRETVGDAIKCVAIKADEKNLELVWNIESSVPDRAKGDPWRLRQIIVNILGNAIKFTDRGEVSLSVSLASESDKDMEVHISVSDTGIGIPAHQQKKIFESFAQADGSAERSHSGTGLGLSIVSRLTQLMNGRVWVESEVGKGSTFHFTVKLERQDPALNHQDAEYKDLRGVSALIVDDNAINRQFLSETLRGWEMLPAAFDSGQAALDEMKRQAAGGFSFQLILVDAHMPSMDGYSFVDLVHKNPAFSGASIMMLTSLDLEDNATRCEALNISMHLVKPIKQSELLKAVLYVLGGGKELRTAELPGKSSRGVHGQSLRILVAEDNVINQQVAVGLIGDLGHAVSIAGNGKQALKMCESETYDCIFMDIQMPEMNGFQATAAIRAKELLTGTHVPIIALTSHAMTGYREQCLSAGMDGYLSKPIQIDELSKILESFGAERQPEQSTKHSDEPEGPFGREKALAQLGGNEKLLRQAATIFLKNYDGTISALEQAIRDRNSQQIREMAHSLKGSVSILAAKEAFEAVLKLEHVGRDGAMDQVSEAFKSAEAETERLRDALLSFVAEGGNV